MPDEPYPLDDILKTIIREGAGEGPDGMYMIASSMVNRAKRRRQTLMQVVNAPKQYSGRWEPDLEKFVAKQGPKIEQQAREALMRAKQQPMPGVDHFLTQELYADERRRPYWANKMKLVGKVGNHVIFDSALRP